MAVYDAVTDQISRYPLDQEYLQLDILIGLKSGEDVKELSELCC